MQFFISFILVKYSIIAPIPKTGYVCMSAHCNVTIMVAIFRATIIAQCLT